MSTIPTENRASIMRRVVMHPDEPHSDIILKRVPIVTSRDFTLYYGKKPGVEKITMDILSNTVTAIIGPTRITPLF